MTIYYGDSVRTACERIAQKIVADLQQGKLAWVRPHNIAETRPFNVVRRVREKQRAVYTGVNRLFLDLQCWSNGWSTPAFLTVEQLKKLNPERDPDGPRLKRVDGGVPLSHDDWRTHGQIGSVALLFKQRTSWQRDGKVVPEGTEGAEERMSAYGRSYLLFNVEQCVNLPADILEAVTVARSERAPTLPSGSIARALEGLRLRGGVQPSHVPCYIPSKDGIGMPPAEAFVSQQALDATWLHEMGHACGHASRCGREQRESKNTRNQVIAAYAREELCAEFTSAFAQEAFGLPAPDTLNHAAYLQHYIELLKAEPEVLVWAASQAEKRTNLLVELASERISSAAAE